MIYSAKDKKNARRRELRKIRREQNPKMCKKCKKVEVDGRRMYCDPCKKELKKQYYQDNKEDILESKNNSKK